MHIRLFLSLLYSMAMLKNVGELKIGDNGVQIELCVRHGLAKIAKVSVGTGFDVHGEIVELVCLGSSNVGIASAKVYQFGNFRASSHGFCSTRGTPI